MKIEKVSTADAEKLLAIYAPYVEETAISFEYEVPSVDVFRNRIEQISAKYPYIKAVVDGKIAGYAYAAGFKDRKAYDWSVETTIYIRKDCRQMGLGKALYENLEKLLKEMGILTPAQQYAADHADTCKEDIRSAIDGLPCDLFVARSVDEDLT